MSVRSPMKWIVAFGVLALAAGPAGAAPSSPNGNAGNSPPSGVGPDGQVNFQAKTSLSPAEQLSESGKHLTRMEGVGVGVRKMLEEARRQRDVVKTLCLNDKLSQVDVAIRSARERRQQLEAAAKRNDVELSGHEFTILTVLRQRSEQLVAEANQ